MVTSMISALISCHFNKEASCCEGTLDEALLNKAKSILLKHIEHIVIHPVTNHFIKVTLNLNALFSCCH